MRLAVLMVLASFAAFAEDTHLDHFSVGLDALARYSVASKPDGQGREGIASIAFLPRIRYVF